MRKKLIALAVATVPIGQALAQSNVQIYGLADVAYVNTNYGGNKKTQNAIDSTVLDGSHIGFRGSEDLGNDLKAIFALEYRVDLDSNTSIGSDNPTRVVARQQYVGLTGGFGTLVAGRLQAAVFQWLGGLGPATELVGSPALGAHHLVGMNGGFFSATGRLNNAIGYTSPAYAGITVGLAHGRLTERASITGNADSAINQAAISYKNGPFTAGFAWSRASDWTLGETGTLGPGYIVGTTSAPTVDGISAGYGRSIQGHALTEIGLRAGYDFGVVKVMAIHQTMDNFAPTAMRNYKDKKNVISVVVPVSTGKIVGEYAKANMESLPDAKAYTLMYQHNLSKRSALYGAFARFDSAGPATSDYNRFAFGMLHRF